MIGIAIFTHRELGKTLLRSAETIVGPQEKIVVLSVTKKDSLMSIKERCRESLKSLDDGSGILILTDMFGGSASNACLGFVNEFPLEIVAGVNLPVLISAFVNRPRMGLKELAVKVLEDGKKSIVNAKEIFLNKLR